MILHGLKPSVFFRKVRIILEEKNIPYRVKFCNPRDKTPQLYTMNPLGKIPILEHDDFFVADSTVISHYLEEAFPEVAMIPKDPKSMARALFFNAYADTRLHEVIIKKMYYQRVILPLFGQEGDENMVQQAFEEDLPIICEYLESTLKQEKETLIGESFNIADASIMAYLSCLAEINIEIDKNKYPCTHYYVSKNSQRNSVISSLESVTP